MNLLKRIIGLLLILVLSGCSQNDESIVIQKGEFGYDLTGCMDKEQNSVLDALYKAKADPQFHAEVMNLGSKARGYVMPEVIQGLDFDTSICFVNYPDPSVFSLFRYERKLYFDHWPEEEEQNALQSILDHMVDIYGEPWQKNNISDENTLFDKYKISRYAEWEDGLICFSVAYDMETKETLIWIFNYNSQFENDHYEETHGMKRPYYKENG